MKKNADQIKRQIVNKLRELILNLVRKSDSSDAKPNLVINDYQPDSAITVDDSIKLLEMPELAETAKQAYVQGLSDQLIKYGLSIYDLAGVIPGVGGIVEGVAKPSEGASRAETALFGGGGSLLGALLGSIAGAGLTAKVKKEGDDRQIIFNPAAALTGGALGGIGGNILGRWLVKRDVSPSRKELEDIKKIIEELKRLEKNQITINVAPSNINDKTKDNIVEGSNVKV